MMNMGMLPRADMDVTDLAHYALV